MIWTEATCIFYGPSFSPARARQLTGLVFGEQNEPSESGAVGRYKGKPVPYGSSVLVPPHQVTRTNADYGIEWLVDTVASEKKQFESAGVSDVTLNLNVYHDGLCNLEFTPRLLTKIAASGVILTLSCYEDAAYVQKRLSEAEAKGLS